MEIMGNATQAIAATQASKSETANGLVLDIAQALMGVEEDENA